MPGPLRRYTVPSTVGVLTTPFFEALEAAKAAGLTPIINITANNTMAIRPANFLLMISSPLPV